MPHTCVKYFGKKSCKSFIFNLICGKWIEVDFDGGIRRLPSVLFYVIQVRYR
jgi:hypothetical protein